MKQKANDHQSLAFLLEYINFEISMFRCFDVSRNRGFDVSRFRGIVRMASQGLIANGQWLFFT